MTLAVVGLFSTTTLAQDLGQELTAQERAEIMAHVEKVTQTFLQAVENDKPLTDLSQECPADMVAQDPEYYSDNPDTQKFCVANPCHCF